MRTILLLAVAATAFCQQPRVSNAQMENRTYSGNLETQLRADRPTWFGYALKTVAKNLQSCGWNDSAGCVCSLEGTGRSTSRHMVSGSPIQLEGSDEMAILFRVSNDGVEKIRAYSLACPLDAGGLPFVWLSGVPPDASLALLGRMVRSDSQSESNGALFAISQHQGSGALNMLVELAQHDASSHVRRQALFWLAQRAGERASATISNAIENDPDGEVKKSAVFALSQLPKDEAIPKLIAVARSQRNPEVRKQAFFWLGQSQDPRAFAFIQEVLSK